LKLREKATASSINDEKGSGRSIVCVIRQT
jgi:hypothetical protein